MFIPLEIMTSFPKIELSYEKVLHKKVPADIYMLIPKGFKVFVWLTKWQEKNVCLVISKNKINETKIYPYPYIYIPEYAVGMGTIMHGTLFDYKDVKHFSCEDIFYYKGHALSSSSSSLERKFDLLKDFFINKPSYNGNAISKSLIIGLPVMTTKVEEAFELAAQLPYIVYSIQLHLNNNTIRYHKIGAYLVKNGMPEDLAQMAPKQMPMPIVKPIPYANSKEVILNVRASLEDDIYNLYCLENDTRTEKFLGVAMISTYKSSVMMNKLFRNIRENNNLDFLEESEDEEDFENMDITKYVDLEKSLLMKCVYSKRFKRWQPLSVINQEQDQDTTTSLIFTYTEIKKREY